MKIKVIGKDNVGWSIDKDRANLIFFLSQIKGVQITRSYIFADVYFFIWHDQILSPKYFFVSLLGKIFKKKTIAWITNDITQNTDFLTKDWPVELFISPSEKVSNFLEKNNFKFKTIPFYVSPKIYNNLRKSREELCHELGFDFRMFQDRFLIGSFQRDSLGDDLLSPKWQKNPELLIRICKSLPKDKILLVLAGPRRHYLIERCKKEMIPYVFLGDKKYIENLKDDIFVNNLKEEVINKLYNLIDLYLITSQSEGGPKAVIESALSETAVFSTDVGLAKDFLHPDLIYKKEDISILSLKIINIIEKKIESSLLDNYKKYNYDKAIRLMDESNYRELLREVIFSL